MEQFTLSRNEWCISRQRSWGVPIPVFYELETDVPLLTDSSVEHIIEIFKEHGSDEWWKLEYKNNGNYNRIQIVIILINFNNFELHFR